MGGAELKVAPEASISEIIDTLLEHFPNARTSSPIPRCYLPEHMLKALEEERRGLISYRPRLDQYAAKHRIIYRGCLSLRATLTDDHDLITILADNGDLAYYKPSSEVQDHMHDLYQRLRAGGSSLVDAEAATRRCPRTSLEQQQVVLQLHKEGLGAAQAAEATLLLHPQAGTDTTVSGP